MRPSTGESIFDDSSRLTGFTGCTGPTEAVEAFPRLVQVRSRLRLSRAIPNHARVIHFTYARVCCPISSYIDGQFEVGHEVESCDTVTLQWAAETRTIVASRTPAEREKNPDRMRLDRRGLTMFPHVVGEPKLRLMSLQHNLLTRIDAANLTRLTKLVFLDLYDNQIEKICELDPLANLRVLLIGKNRVRRIEGLRKLGELEVLDLHGNQIQQITGLDGLSSLKVLNLAGNNIKAVGFGDLQGLNLLKELNLRRNKLRQLLGFGGTPQLQKLYLSNNDIHK